MNLKSLHNNLTKSSWLSGDYAVIIPLNDLKHNSNTKKWILKSTYTSSNAMASACRAPAMANKALIIWQNINLDCFLVCKLTVREV